MTRPDHVHVARILHPTDFSPAGERALRYAALLAHATGAELHLVHVVVYPEVLAPSEAALKHACAEAETRLAEVASGIASVDTVKTSVRIGTPHVEVIDAAHELRVDLVVMGTAGLTGDPGNPVGSTAEKVIRALDVPVLTVKAAARPAKAGRACSMCGQASGDVLCNGCKERIRGEALAGRRV